MAFFREAMINLHKDKEYELNVPGSYIADHNMNPICTYINEEIPFISKHQI